jgi:hypothetical protein
MTNKDDWGFPVEEKVSDYFNFKEGETKLRVMTQPIGVRQYFKDGKFETVDEKYTGPEKVSTKGWAWCSIRPDNELKIVKFPYSVIKQVQAFMVDEEYSFDGFPMPYDLKITATGEGMERRYSVLASPKLTPVTAEEKAELEKKTPIQDILSKMKGKVGIARASAPVGIDYPEGDSDGIPF